MPAPDVSIYLAEDLRRTSGALRYGALIPAEVDLTSGGTWDSLDDGTLVWRQRFLAPGALSVALEFSEFELPHGAQLFVYDDALQHVAGAFTAHNHQANGGFVFSPIPGDALTLELVLPAAVTELPRLATSQLIYDYRDVLSLAPPPALNASGGTTCNVGVNCPEGAGWEQQTRATMRTLSDGIVCSAVLLNNTARDGTAYVLTLSECDQSPNTVFRFNFVQPGCGTGTAPTNQTVTGFTLLANDPAFYGRLGRIDAPIPANFEPVFAGWTRSTAPTPLAVTLSHPLGSPMEIVTAATGASAQDDQLWTANSDSGLINQSSGGGGLFDVNGRVLGNACCVDNFICGSQTGFFGRFDQFYTNSSLAQWLDPLGADPLEINLFDPSAGPGGTAPVIASVAPLALDAITVDGPPTVTLTGTGFTGTQQVLVDGLPLDELASEWSVIDDTQLTLIVPPQAKLGLVDITVTDPIGSDTAQVMIQANASPVIELLGSDPGSVSSSTGLTIYSASQPGDIFYVLGSLSNVPTVLPGLVNSAIGNNGLALKILDVRVINGTTGYETTTVPLSGVSLPPGTKLYVEGAVIDGVTLSLPAQSTNLQVGTFVI